MNTSSPEKTAAGEPLRVVFAPDFREVVPYQSLLAEAVRDEKTRVDFLSGYRRLMPLYRGLRGVPMDLLHMHFPIHYMLKGRQTDFWRKLRFSSDLHLALRRAPLVYTIHDLYPLDDRVDFFVETATLYLLRRSNALIVHSEVARQVIIEAFDIPPEKCAVIPHGDLSVSYGLPLDRTAARSALGITFDGKICLAFGSQNPSKGLTELIAWWRRHKPDAMLAVVGRSWNKSYAHEMDLLAEGTPNVLIRRSFQSDEEVRLWFSAADCTVINYRRIFTTGVGSLARSYGLPVLLPLRNSTVDLHEPHPYVHRFDSLATDFGEKLADALACEPDYNAGVEWRAETAWDVIAAQTRRVYAQVCGG